jgi:hypothetical protein
MARSAKAPPITPCGDDQDVYMVENHLGRHGRMWPEAVSDTTDFEAVITDPLTRQYTSPVRVIAFKLPEGWSDEASAGASHELRRRRE